MAARTGRRLADITVLTDSDMLQLKWPNNLCEVAYERQNRRLFEVGPVFSEPVRMQANLLR
jgi:hypothetical protein